MESVHKLEAMVGSWYKSAPHLPKGGQKWLADNIWWLTAIGAVLGVLALLALVPLALFAFGFSAAVGGGMMMGGYAYGYNSGFVWLTVLVSLATLVLYVVLSGMAITPLKAHKKRGWNALFLLLIVDVVSAVLSLVVAFSFSSFLSSIIGAAISAYLLFEIRGYFLGAKAVVKEVKKA